LAYCAKEDWLPLAALSGKCKQPSMKCTTYTVFYRSNLMTQLTHYRSLQKLQSLQQIN